MKFQDTGATPLITTGWMKSLKQLSELRDGKLLSPLACFGSGSQQRAIAARQQIVANCFPLVAEAQAHEAEERLAIQVTQVRIDAGRQSHNCRVHFGRRTKC